MSDPLAEQDDTSTPLSAEEREGLIRSDITLRGELNAAEQNNILEADSWALSRKRNVLNERFLHELHKRMYGNVWRWAGQYRQSQKNIGVEYYRIPTDLRTLLEDSRYWIEHQTFEPDEIAARFHHRLVWIHCYPNGNGRHARLTTDLLLRSLNRDRFSWGSANLGDAGATRAAYIAALKAADNNDYGPLLAFVRS